jgi:hypothetical protein
MAFRLDSPQTSPKKVPNEPGRHVQCFVDHETDHMLTIVLTYQDTAESKVLQCVNARFFLRIRGKNANAVLPFKESWRPTNPTPGHAA